MMGLSMLVYQYHVLQRCHPACGHEGSYRLTLSATGARTKDLISSRIELSTPRYNSDLRGYTSTWYLTRATGWIVQSGMTSTLFSSSLQQHLKGREQCRGAKYSSTRQIPNEFFGIPHAPINVKAICCQSVLNQIGHNIISVAEVRASALLHAIHNTTSSICDKTYGFRGRACSPWVL